jgi:hypothetical protein
MKKYIIVASVLLVLGIGAGVFGFQLFNQAAVEERYARNLRAIAVKYADGVSEDSTRETREKANEAGADAEGYRNLGWVFVTGAIILVGTTGVILIWALAQARLRQRKGRVEVSQARP